MDRRSPISRWGFVALGPADPASFYLGPRALLSGGAAEAAIEAGTAIPIGRPGEAAACLEILVRQDGGARSVLVAAADFPRWLDTNPGPAADRLRLLAGRLSAPRRPWAGLALDRPLVMGIVNVTPDSFSDGGDFLDPAAAVAHGLALRGAGADILDIGGESTRPGAEPVPPEVEVARVVPVVRALAEAGAIVSIDTRHTPVMAAAVEAGARIVNDVTALQDKGAVELAARLRLPVALMHMQGAPQTMQADPRYDHAVLDVFDFLEARIAACEAAGIARADILVDPGIGFGKSLAHNLQLLDGLGLLRATGCGLLLGVSRKGFIARVRGGSHAKSRLGGSLGAGLAGIMRGADMLRVHDVAETVQALSVVKAIDDRVVEDVL
ncbi:MAG TPA: dihydropteroate synthase [Aliidongia sp.]|nr:dihydropteroate synthase [Aliidongia sp.]